jgi:hypothetical protein
VPKCQRLAGDLIEQRLMDPEAVIAPDYTICGLCVMNRKFASQISH